MPQAMNLTRAKLAISLAGAVVAEVDVVTPETVVGRAADCDIVIDDATVSRRHAVLRVVEAGIRLEDLGSRNGTRVNGALVTGRLLAHHDRISIGLHELRFGEAGFAASGARPAPANAAVERETPGNDITKSRSSGADLALRVLRGEGAGQRILLRQVNTLIGDARTDSALIVRRSGMHVIVRLHGSCVPRLNAIPLGPGAHPLHRGDRLDLGRSRFQVVQAT